MKDQIEGTVNETVGAGKSAIGQEIAKHTDNKELGAKLVAEGETQKAQGGLQKIIGDAKDRINGAISDVKSAIEDKTH